MPKKLFIGFDSPVPPSSWPLSARSRNFAFSAALSELRMYQTNVSWHHAMKAVAPQISAIAEMPPMVSRRSACADRAPISPKQRIALSGKISPSSICCRIGVSSDRASDATPSKNETVCCSTLSAFRSAAIVVMIVSVTGIEAQPHRCG